MTDDLLARLRELSPGKQALLERLLLSRCRPDGAATAAIPPRDGSRPCRLSPFQERIWLLEQLEPGVPLYHRTWAGRLRGPLDVAALQTALNRIVERHESLRMAIRVVDGIPTQVFHASRPVGIACVEIPGGEGACEAALDPVLRAEARRAFDLEREPPVRATVFRLNEADHVLALTLHHLACDDWSMRILFRELSVFYAAAVQGRSADLPPVPVGFGDVAAWQRERLETASAAEDIAYATAQLRGAPPILALPADRPRPARLSYRGATRTTGLGPALSGRLREQSRSEGVSLFVLLLAAFVTLLARYSGREDIVLGIPITSRDRLELEPLIGPLIDTAVLRIDLAGLRSFRDVLRRARSALAGAYAHRTLSFERLVDLLRPERALDHTPVFQVMLGWLEPESQIRSLELHGLTVSPVPVDRGTSKFDLTLLLTETEGEIVAEAEYSTDLFDGASIDRLLGRFGTLLDGIGTGREARWWQLPLATAAERHQLLVEWNDTRQDYPAGRTVHGLFAGQAAETPDAVAVEFGDQQLTYRELDRRANQLAHYLRASGVGPDVRVAVAVSRSLEMVVALLGVLKAGGAYLPLDPTWPRKRLAFMLEDSAATVLLTQRRAPPCGLPTAGSAGMPVVRLDADWSEIARASDAPPADLATPGSLAYVMYTSGSTGVPKGVGVPHRAVVRLVRNASYARLAADEVFLQLAPLPFDASSFEVWGSLLNGARLAVYPAEPPTVDGLLRAVHRYQVTILWLTAAFFRQVVDHAPGGLGPVRQVLAGGDVLSAPHVRRVLREWKGVRLVNGYGPTENATFTCCHLLTEADAETPSVPIGRPIANTRVYVLDRYMEPVPVGIPGELYAGGDGVARGYLNRPELTAERFVPDPWSSEPGARLYRTGDLVRWRPDGTLQFLGRTDDQLKIRGFRVEPGEVEAVLGEHPAIRTVAVVGRDDARGDRCLVAYHVPRDGGGATPDELRRYLGDRLPGHMIPAAFVQLPALPITSSGKVDRLALPDPPAQPERDDRDGPPEPPAGPLEELVAGVWAEVLRLPRVARRADFFALGGHSLLAFQIIARLRTLLGLELPGILVFEAPTVAQLSARLAALRSPTP